MTANGAAVSGPDPSRVLVFQDPTLFPWRSVRDNVATGPQARGIAKEAQPRIDAALALVGLSDFAAAYPHQLSGGMAQRAALVRALEILGGALVAVAVVWWAVVYGQVIANTGVAPHRP